MSGRSRPVLAIGILALVILVSGVSIALPVTWALRIDAEIEVSRDRLEPLRRAVSGSGGLSEESVAGLFIGGGSPGRSAADLQLRVTSAARSHDITVRSIQALAPRPVGDLSQVSVEVAFRAGIAAMRDLLHTVETGSPILIIDELSIHVLPVRAGERDRPVELEASMKVRGFAVMGGAP